MTNTRRKARAALALKVYAVAHGADTWETLITDLLADLFHLVGDELTIDSLLASAKCHYYHERKPPCANA